jgi:AraC-like DNA-binding protein
MVNARLLAIDRSWQQERFMRQWHHLVMPVRGRLRIESDRHGPRNFGPADPPQLIPAHRHFVFTGLRPGLVLIAYLDPDALTICGGQRSWPSEPGRELCLALQGLAMHGLNQTGTEARRLWATIAAEALRRGYLAMGLNLSARHGKDLRTLLSAIDESLQFPWTLPEMARRLHCSVTHVGRRFAEAGLQAPLREVRERRMQKAAMLLRETDRDLHDIADMCGFARPFALSRAFKRRFGQSPRSFRRE